jgi:pimeloyl-ACP methyl ester carboxylesterase
VGLAFAGGSGPRTIFLHGLMGLNEHWDTSVRWLAGHLRCEMLEFPLLELPPDDGTVAGVTALVIQYLEETAGQREPVVLVGNSFGGHVALRVAMERPELVSALVLAGASGLWEYNGIHDFTTRPTLEWMRTRLEEIFHDPRHVRDEEIARVHEAVNLRSFARALLRISRSVRRDCLADRLGAVRAPSLLVWGRQDRITPPDVGYQFANALPGARLAWIDDCGHAPMIEHPDRFAAEVSAFVGSVLSEPAAI